MKLMCFLACSRMYKFKAPGGLQIRRQACIQTQQNLLVQTEIHHLSQFTFRRMINGRCNYDNFQSDDKTNTEWDIITIIISRTRMFWKGKHWDQHFGVIQAGSENLRNPHAPTFEDISIEWASSMEEKTRKAAWFLHHNVHNSMFVFCESIQVLQAKFREKCFFIFSTFFEGERIHCGLGSITSYDVYKWFDSRKTRNDSRVEGPNILWWLQMELLIRMKKEVLWIWS